MKPSRKPQPTPRRINGVPYVERRLNNGRIIKILVPQNAEQARKAAAIGSSGQSPLPRGSE